MHAKPDKVRVRRFKRRLKAAFSIGVAICAGVFLACQKTPLKDDSIRRDSEDADTDSNANEGMMKVDANGDALVVLPPPVDAGKPDALVRRGPDPKDAAVDRHEHRKGMPVPDNLLE